MQNELSRIGDLKSSLLQEEGALSMAEKELERLEKELSLLIVEERVLTSVELVLTELSGKILDQSTSPIDRLVTSGLRFIFDDNRLEFRTDIERFRGRTTVKFSLLQDGEEAPIMESYGGGVIVVVGVLLRVVTVMALKARRVLVLDETLADVSDQYITNVSKFLKELCVSLDFTIILVTHNVEFAANADHHFKFDSAPGESTRLVKLR